MTQRPKISIIVATYNRWDLLQRWIVSVRDQSYTNVEMIVVDNGSDAETEENMRAFGDTRPVFHSASVTGRVKENVFPKIRYMKPGTNTGFAGGNNLGAKQATGEYFFLLNNDAFLGKDTLSDLAAYAEQHPDVAVMQPTILIGDGSESLKLKAESWRSNGTGSFFTQWGFLWHRGYQDSLAKLPQEPGPIFTALGAGMLIRADVVKRHGLFDESFFNYFEETDFCWRLWTRGEQVMYVPTDPMWHMGGETSKTFKEKMVIFDAYRNRLTAFWRHLERDNLVTVLFYHQLAIFGLMLALLPKRPSASGWLLLVLGWELWHLPRLFATRAEHLGQRTVSDATLWPKIYRERSLAQMMQYL